MSEHSPGPWKYCGASNGECSCGLVWDATGNNVVAHVVREDDDHLKSEPLFLANAHLIASAPDLLARAETAEAARDENYAKYRAAIEANEDWHKEVTALRDRLAETVKERDGLVDLLRRVWLLAECACPRSRGPVFPPGGRDHLEGCSVHAAYIALQAITTQRDTKQEAQDHARGICNEQTCALCEEHQRDTKQEGEGT